MRAARPPCERTRALLWGLLVFGVLDQLRLVAATPDHSLESGIWPVLADDLLHGELYRPLLEGGRFGGTRYMPAFFVLLAGCLRLVGEPVVAAGLLFQSTVGMLVAALWAVLRELDVPPGLRGPLAGLVLCTATYQDAWFNPRCEYLAASLALVVLLGLLRYARGGSCGWLAGIALAAAAAFFVKASTIAALLVPAAWLVWHGRVGLAAALSGASLAACGLGLAALEWLSGGRFLVNVLATMAGSGSSDSAGRFFRSFLGDQVWGDPFMGVMLGAAVLGWLVLLRSPAPADACVLLFSLAALLETFVLHTADGIVGHHNVWLHVCCLLTLGRLLKRPAPGVLLVRLAAGSVLVLFLATWLPGVPSVREHQQSWGATTRPRIRELLQDVPIGSYYYASNPMLPLTRGERPVALDFAQGLFLAHWSANGQWWFDRLAAFLPAHLRDFRAAARSLAADFAGRARRKEFVAVVLTDWQHVLPAQVDEAGTLAPEQEEDLWRSQYPPFQALRSSYRVARIRRPYVLLIPR